LHTNFQEFVYIPLSSQFLLLWTFYIKVAHMLQLMTYYQYIILNKRVLFTLEFFLCVVLFCEFCQIQNWLFLELKNVPLCTHNAFLAVLWFELRVLHLVGRYSTIWASPPALLVLVIFEIASHFNAWYRLHRNPICVSQHNWDDLGGTPHQTIG
jgi:hypothetical protein